VSGAWRIERERGPAGLLHQASAERVGATRGSERLLRVLEPTVTALVLGSAQPESHVDRRRTSSRGVAVVRRRSGGGAVLVDPGGLVWVDLVLPEGDPLWRPDIGRAAWWVGECWAEALAAIGVGQPLVWRAGMRPSRWSDRACFAGLAAGEVLVSDRKMVGVAQRRTRSGALFQTAALLHWDPGALVDLLALSALEREQATTELAGTAAGLGKGRGQDLLEALIEAVQSV